MTQQEILQTALAQSAIDSGCHPEDFLSGENKVVLSQAHPEARKYLQLPFFCDFTTYGSGIVASVDPRAADFVKAFLARFPAEQCFETPAMHLLTQAFEKYDAGPCFMAEYFLPELRLLEPRPCPYEIRILQPEDFAGLYQTQWSNALCSKRRSLDRLAAGAYDKGRLVGLAGASADCETMWQIGIDVLPECRRAGGASALTARLALELLQRGKVPFYCCAWSNLASARNAIKSGFRPAWVQLTSVKRQRIEQLLSERE